MLLGTFPGLTLRILPILWYGRLNVMKAGDFHLTIFFDKPGDTGILKDGGKDMDDRNPTSIQPGPESCLPANRKLAP